MDDVAKETKVLHCTEYNDVDTEAVWVEREQTYPERSYSKLAKGGAQSGSGNDL